MKEPLVLLPAMMCDARVFSHQINALSRERTVVVAPLTQGERVEEIASALLDSLPQKYALAGLSLGGIVAMELLRRAPDRITRACLMSCSPLAESPAEAAAREPLMISARMGRIGEAASGTIPPGALAPGPGRLQVQALLGQMAADLGAEAFVRQCRALQKRRDQQNTLRRCKLPVLVMCGAADTLVPPRRQAFLAELMPNAGYEVIDDAGHLLPLEQPAAVTGRLRDWLGAPPVLR